MRAWTISVLPILFAVPTLGQTVDLCTLFYSDVNQACQMFLDAGHACSTSWSDVCTNEHQSGAKYNSVPLSGFGCAQCPSPLDTCFGARAALNFDLVCGPEDERMPGEGACASDACAALVNSLTDANVQLRATGFASCTGTFAATYFPNYANVGALSQALQGQADQCGLTAPFTTGPFAPPSPSRPPPLSPQTVNDADSSVVGAAVGGAVGGVVVLFAVVAAIVYCLMKKKAQASKPPGAAVATPVIPVTPAAVTVEMKAEDKPKANKMEEQLSSLKSMLDKGLITGAEYDAKKKDILSAM